MPRFFGLAGVVASMVFTLGCGGVTCDEESGNCEEEELCVGAVGADDDGDGIDNTCDVCAAGADQFDADGDGIPDACDVCAAGDDALDADSDGVADACDVCPSADDALDADGDGVPDGCDICAVGADGIDTDSDGVADACDVCPGDNPDDSNDDLVCDSGIGFDLAYLSEYSFSTNISGISSTGVLINTGLVDIDLSTLSIVSFENDGASTVTPSVSAPATMLTPGSRAGGLSPLATTEIITSGLVSEPAIGGGQPSLGYSFNNVVAGDHRLAIVLEAGGVQIRYNVLFHFVAGGGTTFDSTARIESPRDLDTSPP